MERIDYVKAAILNNRGMYDEATADARNWRAASLDYQVQAARDFETLHGAEVAACFPWLFPTGEELRAGYQQAIADLLEMSRPELMGCRSGSAIYWDPAEGRYLVADGSGYGPDRIAVTHSAETLERAMEICDNRAGVCHPLDNPPETLREW